jgi:cytoskeletal protein RodZ
MGLGAGWWFFGRSEPVAAADGATTSTAAEQANRSASAMREITTATGTTALGVPIAPAGAAGPNAYNGATYATAPQASALEGTTTGTSVNAIEGAIVPALPTADVVSGAATILPAAVGQDSVIVAVSPAAPLVPADATVATTVSDTTAATAAASGSSTTTTLAPSGGRQINLLGAGADQLQLTFTGDSWVEIDDGRNARLYNEMLRGGDTLLVQGQAPFQVLFGDGRNVAVTFNSSPIDISSSIRNDSTSRITLSNTATMSVQTDESSAGIQSTATEPAAATATSNGNATSNNGVVQ